MFQMCHLHVVIHKFSLFPACRGHGCQPEERERASAEESGGVCEGDGEDDGWIQQDEDRSPADGCHHGSAEKRKRSCQASGALIKFIKWIISVLNADWSI